MIKRSEHSTQVDKEGRKYLKSILVNFERNGGDAVKAVKLELVKFECTQLAREHFSRSLLVKGLCSLIKAVI